MCNKMATMVKLSRQVSTIVEEVYSKKNETEASRSKEYAAVVKIQSWYRGLRERAYITHLGRSAKTVQKLYRGFTGRNAFRVYLKNQVFVMKLDYYNAQATKIQKVWRSFFVQKYVFNYYSFKRYLSGLMVKNAALREKLAAYKEQQEQDKMIEEQKLHRQAKEKWLRKHHHLVSTTAVPGIYNSPYLPFPTDIELDLRRTKPSATHTAKKPTVKFNPTASNYDLPRPPTLPPLISKPQGPFREPEDVRNQRYKPFKPSLQVETSYFALEEAREQMKRDEWVGRVNDTGFKPFTKYTKPYEPLHHTALEYGHLPYGNKYFREEHPDKFVVRQNMKTVVPPIPIFDKLNDTYSQGEV